MSHKNMVHVQLLGVYYGILALCLLVLIVGLKWDFLTPIFALLIVFSGLRCYGSAYPWKFAKE